MDRRALLHRGLLVDSAAEIPELNTIANNALKGTNGTLAFVRPRDESALDDLVEQAVLGLLHARRNQQVMARQ